MSVAIQTPLSVPIGRQDTGVAQAPRAHDGQRLVAGDRGIDMTVSTTPRSTSRARRVGTSLAVGVAALGLAGGLLAGPAFAGEVSRTGGQDRIDTALEIYRQNRSVFTSDTVVLAQSNGFADALTATPLAAALKAPILTVAGGLDRASWPCSRSRASRTSSSSAASAH